MNSKSFARTALIGAMICAGVMSCTLVAPLEDVSESRPSSGGAAGAMEADGGEIAGTGGVVGNGGTGSGAAGCTFEDPQSRFDEGCVFGP